MSEAGGDMSEVDGDVLEVGGDVSGVDGDVSRGLSTCRSGCRRVEDWWRRVE